MRIFKRKCVSVFLFHLWLLKKQNLLKNIHKITSLCSWIIFSRALGAIKGAFLIVTQGRYFREDLGIHRVFHAKNLFCFSNLSITFFDSSSDFSSRPPGHNSPQCKAAHRSSCERPELIIIWTDNMIYSNIPTFLIYLFL